MWPGFSLDEEWRLLPLYELPVFVTTSAKGQEIWKSVLDPIFSVSPKMGQLTSRTLRSHWSNGV